MAFGTLLFLIVFIIAIVILVFVFKFVKKVAKIVITAALIGILFFVALSSYLSIQSFSSEDKVFLLTTDGQLNAIFAEVNDVKDAVMDETIYSAGSAKDYATLQKTYPHIVYIDLAAFDNIDEIEYLGKPTTRAQYLSLLKSTDKEELGLVFMQMYNTANEGMWYPQQLKAGNLEIYPNALPFKMASILPDFLVGSTEG